MQLVEDGEGDGVVARIPRDRKGLVDQLGSFILVDTQNTDGCNSQLPQTTSSLEKAHLLLYRSSHAASFASDGGPW